jgi:hypothetical protein
MDKPEPELDLNALRKGLDTRLYYADEANKNAYQEKVNTILEPVRDWYQSKNAGLPILQIWITYGMKQCIRYENR